MKNTLSLFLAVFMTASISLGQSFNLTEGDLGPVKGENKINLEFTYDNMGVGKFAKEEDYINTKIADYNAKEPGRGERWAEAWKADRANRYEPSFIQLYNKHGKTQMVGDFPDARYTMIFNTKYTEPGFNVYVTRKNAHINADITIVETANRSKVVAKISMLKSPGRTFGGNDYDTGTRIEESYAAAGKRLAMFIMK